MQAAHLDLDRAWSGLPAHFSYVDAAAWGPRLRYWARSADLQRFYDEVLRDLPPLVVYGSGDFHHLAGWLVRRFEGPLTIVSFDNHPDWDIRPPRWSCGCWVNRALELPSVERVSVWGCGNFELAFPSRLFRNRRAISNGTLQVHAWAERQTPATCRRFDCMTRDNWRERFSGFAESLAGRRVYITVDMDCLSNSEAVSNWEQGLLSATDIAWAINQLRERSQIPGADICGAASEPVYERRFQRFAGGWDHPKIALPAPNEINRLNLAALQTISTSLV
jgi:arginase family enzyme